MVKLPSSLSEAIDNEYKTYPAQSMLDSALAYARNGWPVFPLRGKEPALAGKGGHNLATTDEAQIRSWWKQYPNANIGGRMVGRVAVDLDFQNGAQRLQAFPDTRTHHSGRGNGNLHLIYKVEPGSLADQIPNSTNTFGPGIDARTSKGYVVLPPSVHPDTGMPYTLDPVFTHEHTLTDEEVLGIYEEAGVSLTAKGRGASKGLAVVDGEKNWQRPMDDENFTLSGLLQNPPKEGGRNDWLTRVAGHYAKMHRTMEDVYRVHVLKANEGLETPLPLEEVEKTLESIWSSENENHPERSLNSANGYLSGDRRNLFCQVKIGDDYATAPYADFDVEAKGVAVDESSRRVYWVRFHWGDKPIDTTLPGEVLGHDAQLKVWLSGRGMSVATPPSAVPPIAPSTRLLRYLNSQNPPKVQIVTTLGWDETSGGFVTHEGLITADGFKAKEQAGVVANPALIERDVAPYAYGFERTPQVAKEVLAEVLTFQEPDTTSVFGAWWAASLLKSQIQTRTSLFPIFGVEAASESGKTNGFFEMMVALNGNTRGQVVPTKPVLRDLASANNAGIVWADDLNDLQPYEEILRASTSNGTASKMQADRSGITNTAIVAPILVSGEALGFGDQKALVDRSVVLTVNSPAGRPSLHGNYAQWDDIVKLKASFPKAQGGLSVLSGHYVQHAMAHQKQLLDALKEEARKGSGRNADKLAVLRAGARLLDSLVGHPLAWTTGGDHYQRVVAWCNSREQVLSQDNTLTRKILPWALRLWNMPDEPELTTDLGNLNGIRTPAFVEGDLEASQTLDGGGGPQIYYSATYLAEAWAKYHNGKIEPRTESETALSQQAQALGGSKPQSKRVRGTRLTGKYRLVPAEYVGEVLSRVEGR